MFLKALGILDLFAVIIFILHTYTPFKLITLLIICGIYLLSKGVIFLLFGNFLSIIDIICGIVLLVSLLFVLPKLIVMIVCIFLIQKGLFSLIN